MGLIERLGEIPAVLEHSTNISVISHNLETYGWKEINLGFSLAASSSSLDLYKGTERFLIYLSDNHDKETYRLFGDNKIPKFEIVYPAEKTQESSAQEQQISTFAVAKIPFVAKSLENISFPDQQPKSGYLGSFEILGGLAKFLAEIYLTTSSLPKVLNLDRIALIPGTNNFIRLIPPLQIEYTQDWSYLTNQLLEDLNNKDFGINHEGQVKYFENNFTKILTKK